jgi:group I intron endonuclease
VASRVYLIDNTVNGKVYVGITSKTLKERWSSHVYLAEQYAKHKNLKWRTRFINAIMSYGKESFRMSQIADNLSRDEAANLEKIWIILLDSRNPDRGYNSTTGGDGGFNHSELTRQRMCISQQRAIARRFEDSKYDNLSKSDKQLLARRRSGESVMDIAGVKRGSKYQRVWVRCMILGRTFPEALPDSYQTSAEL